MKLKGWWSDDGKWFCVLVDDGTNKATVSLNRNEADELARQIEEDHPSFVALLKKGEQQALAIIEAHDALVARLREIRGGRT